MHEHHLSRDERLRYARLNAHEAEAERLFQDALADVPEAGCALSLGCGIGYYPLLARRFRPDLENHAVEPLPLYRQYFHENIALNGFAASDFTLHPVAIADREGIGTLVEQNHDSWLEQPTSPSGLLARARLLVRGAARPLRRPVMDRGRMTFRVPTLRLDQLLDRIGRPVDLLQMDVQGMEAEILRSVSAALRSGCVRTLLLATHGAELHVDCYRHLSRCGYEIEFAEPSPSRQRDGVILAKRAVARAGIAA